VHEVQAQPEPRHSLVVKNGSKYVTDFREGFPGHYRHRNDHILVFAGGADEELPLFFMASAALSMRFVKPDSISLP